MHDYDFDFAVLGDSKILLEEVHKSLADHFQKRNEEVGFQRYLVAIETSGYADKITLIDSLYGLVKSKWEGEWWNVCIDIQLYMRSGDEAYICYYKDDFYKRRVKVDTIMPVGKISLEGRDWNAPANSEGLLTFIYGNINPDAKYNHETGKYH